MRESGRKTSRRSGFVGLWRLWPKVHKYVQEHDLASHHHPTNSPTSTKDNLPPVIHAFATSIIIHVFFGYIIIWLGDRSCIVISSPHTLLPSLSCRVKEVIKVHRQSKHFIIYLVFDVWVGSRGVWRWWCWWWFYRYMNDFTKALSVEVKMLLEEVGRLRDERRSLQLWVILFLHRMVYDDWLAFELLLVCVTRREIAELMALKSKHGAGGEYVPDWLPKVSTT